MVEVDFDKIVDYSEELIDYQGFLPLLLRNLIMDKWSKQLFKNDLYYEIIQECVDTKPHNYDDAVKELVDWVKHNPQYKDLII